MCYPFLFVLAFERRCVAMYLSRLICQNFRSYRLLEASFAPGINAICGGNGSGKTNVVDAIMYLSQARSARGLPDASSVQHGAQQFAVHGAFSGEAPFSVTVSYEASAGKQLKLDDKPYSRMSDHVGRVPAVPLYPMDIELIWDGGELRRRFMNVGIAQYDAHYLRTMLSYNALLLQRNAFLKTSQRYDAQLLSTYDQQLQPLALAVYQARVEFCQALQPLFQEFYWVLSGGREQVEVRYSSQMHTGDYLSQMEAAREKDWQLQYTSVGVHRDRLLLNLDGYPIRRDGSQGQQKSLIVTLRLAQWQLLAQRSGVTPLLLLDDVFAHLDAGRSECLVDILSRADFGQIFVTSTNAPQLTALVRRESTSSALFKAEQQTLVQVPIN
jgi:DNA replication and repair protein recF